MSVRPLGKYAAARRYNYLTAQLQRAAAAEARVNERRRAVHRDADGTGAALCGFTAARWFCCPDRNCAPCMPNVTCPECAALPVAAE